MEDFIDSAHSFIDVAFKVAMERLVLVSRCVVMELLDVQGCVVEEFLTIRNQK